MRLRMRRRGRRDDLRPAGPTLLLSGIVRVEGDCLRIRNRIYERAFDRKWLRDRMPDAELRRQKAAYRRGLLLAAGVSTSIVLAIGVLALAAFYYAGRAEKNHQEANRRAGELKAALSARDTALTKLETALKAESLEHARADRETERAKGQEKQAKSGEMQAQQQRFEADRQKQLAQERNERLLVAYGARLQDEGDLFGSLLWFVRAESLEIPGSPRQKVNQ